LEFLPLQRFYKLGDLRMENKPTQPQVIQSDEKLVVVTPRSLQTKDSLGSPNPYINDWAEIAEKTRRLVSVHRYPSD
jgi:hypothetical protein